MLFFLLSFSFMNKFFLYKKKNKKKRRVANSHAYGVILTHLTWYSRTHAIDKLLTHLKEITRILTQFYKIENNLLFMIIVTFGRLSVTLFITCFLAAELFVVNFIEV